MTLRSLGFALVLLVPGVVCAAPMQAHTQSASTPATAESTPHQVVENIVAELGKALDGHRAELKKNKSKLIDIINRIFLPHFDVDYASILVLGRHAYQATPEQRERFAKAFYDSITRRYAEGLVNYTKGSVRVLPSRGQPDPQRTVVRTQVMLPDGKAIEVDYAFHKALDGKWKAYDVVIEGISYIINYRSQVDAEIRKIGLDKLIQNLESNGEETLKQMQKGAGN